MKNILVTGSFSVGKSTTVDELEKKIPYNELLITKDLARHYMEKRNLNVNTMKDDEKLAMQLTVMSGYMGSIIEATHAHVMAVMDGSLIEALAYGIDIVPQDTLMRASHKLDEYQNHSIAYVIPPTIPVENDGLRHIDKEYRIDIHRMIMEIIHSHGIPYHLITSQGVEDRADEILYLHKQNNGQNN